MIRAQLRLLVPGVIGNMLEWYDFSLYGYFAPIIAALFFPRSSEFLALLATFSIFAIGFLMRPLGALVFGYYGDTLGRKKTLSISIFLMAVPTTLIGLLPTYQHIGVMAGVLLVICRVIQGFAVGGEHSGSMIYLIENAPKHRRGLYGSFSMFSAFAGLLLGSGMGALVHLLPEAQLQQWGWRLPFLIGSLLGVVGYYLRLKLPETPSFLALQEKKQVVKNPIKTAFTKAPLLMLIAVGLVFLPAMSFYLLFVYLSSYLTTYLHIPLSKALSINTISMLGIILIIPIIGALSDKLGRKPVLLTGALGFIVLSYPLFVLLQYGTFTAILMAQLIFSLLICFAYAAIPTTMVELFQANIRYTAMSFPYHFSNALFGGTAPLVATYLISFTENLLSPSYYLICAGIVTMISILLIPKIKLDQLRHLIDDGEKSGDPLMWDAQEFLKRMKKKPHAK